MYCIIYALFEMPRSLMNSTACSNICLQSEKEALREALERSITDASFKKSERHPRSRRRYVFA